MLARAVASLDLLSGGRASLGLGAGFFWDAVQANGGRRLTPLQGVAALEEAIDIIRGVWDADQPGGVDADGEFYAVHGAERGPAPAHEIPIWLGAHKPKMQDLVGRKADGWLPSLPMMEPDGLSKGTRSSTTLPGPPAVIPARSPGCSTSSRASKLRRHWPSWPSRTVSASSSWPATVRT